MAARASRSRAGRPASAWLAWSCLALVLCAGPVGAFDAETHQKLTFTAVKKFDECIEGTGLMQLTPLEIRYIVQTNLSVADRGFFPNLFRWKFYDRSGQEDHDVLGLIRTRMNEDFASALDAIRDADGFAERYANLGRIVSHLQDATAPAYAVPVFYSRFWRFNLADRFNRYPVDVQALERSLQESCEEFMDGPPVHPRTLLQRTAAGTLDALQQSIDGVPASWQAYWEPGSPDGFGRYGPAGNRFGLDARFPCNGETCRLDEDDPRYAAFALERHRDAVVATMRAMYWQQWQKRARMEERERARAAERADGGSPE